MKSRRSGPRVGIWTMCRALDRLRPVPEKRRPARRGAPRGRVPRGHYKKRVAAAAPGKLVVVDEGGVDTAMTRTRGRAPPGERVPGSAPRGHWTTLTMIGALRLEGVAAEVTVDAK